MDKYKVLSPVDHDNKPYEVGASISLTVDAAAPLLLVGAIQSEIENKSGNTQSVADIKKSLDDLKIEYPAKAKKDELLSLLAEAQKKQADEILETKKQLDDLGVEYPVDADKATLDALLDKVTTPGND